MKNYKFLIGAFMLLFTMISPNLIAQQIKVEGYVKDVAGEPIIGGSVQEEGTTNGVITDLNGHFVLTASGSNAVIRISYLGYKTISLPVTSPLLKSGIVMEEDVMQLGDVVVIGYGTVKKNDLTGSITAIKAEELNRGMVTSASELLQGKVTGLQIIPGGGEPGSGATFRIRGSSSLNASNDPLFVLDGVPLTQNDISSINPNDIESFTVLKDASAAAIYGSRASGGVIIITTKKGATGSKKVNLSYNGAASVKQNIKKVDVMSAPEFRQFITGIYGDRVTPFLGEYDTDWQDLIFRTGFTQDHSVSVSGDVAKNLPYRVSLGYTGEDGTMQESWYNRTTLGVGLSPTLLDDHLKLSINARGYTGASRSSNTLGTAVSYNPTQPPYWYNADGSIDYTTTNGYWNWGTGRGKDFLVNIQADNNPLGGIYDWHYKGRNNGLVANLSADYKIHGFEDLHFTLNMSTDNAWGNSASGTNPGSFNAYQSTIAYGVGTYTKYEWENYNRMLELYANYDHDFDGHGVNAMAGYSWQHKYSHSYNETRFNDDYQNNKKDDVYGNPVTNDTENYLISFFARLNYSYKSRYLLTFTLRDDASSRFSPDTRWGLFPSAALAWNIAEEDFIKEIEPVSSLKLRLSYGVTGQQEIGADYPYLARYTMSTSQSYRYLMGNGGISYFLTPSAYDPKIKWEETATYNAGLDYGFLNGRISGSVDVFLRRTSDLLNSVSIPLGSNFSNTLLTNVGSIDNKGVELSLNVIPVSTKDWNVSVGFNGTFQNTEFTKLTFSDDADYGVQTGTIASGTGGYLQLHKVGYAPYTYYCYQQVYDADGKPIQNAVVDRNGDGIISQGDRYMTEKNPEPDFYYGLNMKVKYRNWDFGFNGHGSVGNWMFNDFYASHSTSNVTLGYSMVGNYARTVLKTGWSDSNSDGQNYSDYWLEDASFFRLDDVNLGYSFSLPQFKALSFRLAASVQNVFVLTKYSGMDPEGTGVSGIDNTIYPRPRTYSLRLNINF